jgi:hypothetical protein
MGRATRKCAVCGEEQDAWRACSVPGCPHEICYCKKDGGDDRAVKEMAKHLDAGHAT